ncbi:MAG: hypothetical protein DYH12_13870 [Sorangiineae bacterium PRO1]|nr:hypothetical protein [Sorangiineae bacterium PRO1]
MKENDAAELGERESFPGWTDEELKRFAATGQKPEGAEGEQPEPHPGCPGCRALAAEILERDRHLAELIASLQAELERRTAGGPDDNAGGQ